MPIGSVHLCLWGHTTLADSNIGERKRSEIAANIVGPSRNLLKEMPPTYQSMLGARYYNSSLPELVARVTGQGTNNPESKIQAEAWIISQLK